MSWLTGFKCPQCGAPHFGSRQNPDGSLTYHCHGTESYSEDVEATAPCGWSGPKEQCFHEQDKPAPQPELWGES